MHLGALIGKLQADGTAAEALEAIGDLALFARVREVAERFEESPGEYVAASVGRFADGADDEAWTGLIGAVANCEDPARTALERMVRWALAADAGSNVVAAGHPGCGGECGP